MLNSTELYRSLSSSQRWFITFVVMAATLMQVIDTTIINVALPHMQGSLGASSDEITWTLTSYLVSSAIFMPLTGYFADRFGRRRYLMASIFGFTVTSALCGAAVSLNEIVLFRLLQGIFGASLVPLSQAILADIFPPEERGKAMAIWGMGVMVGPILGPTLGGYLTEIATWRWTFYVNVPVGVLTLLFIGLIPDTKKTIRQMDWIGLAYISIAIGGLQYVLDRGNSLDWFNSTEINLISYIAFTAFFLFALHNMRARKNIVFDMRLFLDRNFAISCILLAIFGLGLYGMMVIQPMMMEGLFHYPALTAGLILAPRGISAMFSMIVVSRLINRVDPRLLIASGVMLSISGMYVGTYYSLEISPFWLLWPMLLQGFGLGIIFVPLSTIAFATLSSSMRTEAAGLFSLVRTIGGSVGISIAITIYTRKLQLFWHDLAGFIQPYNTSLQAYLQQFHLSLQQPEVSMVLAQNVSQQASMLAFINVYAVIMLCFACMLPLLLLLKKNDAVSIQLETVLD